MYGASARDITPPSYPWSPIRRSASKPIRHVWPTCIGCPTLPSRSINAMVRISRFVQRRTLLAGAVIAAAVPARADAVKIRLGTATPGGGFPVYGAAFVDAVRSVDPGLEIEQVNTKGSTEN